MAFFTRVVGRHGHGHGHGHHRAASSDGGAIGDSGDDQAAAGLSINTSDHDPLLLERGTPPHGAAAGSAPCQPPHPPQPHGSPRAAGGGGGGSHQQQRQRAGAGTPSAGGGRPGSGGGSGGRRRAPLPANPLWVAWRALKAGLCQFALLPSAADALGGGSPGTATTLVAVVLSSPQVRREFWSR